MAAGTTTQVETALRRSVCLVLTCGYLGNHRKVELGGLSMEKDGEKLEGEKDELGASKKLFASRDLRPCEKAISSVKDRLRALSVDGGMRIFGTGAYLIPLLAVEEAERTLLEGSALVQAKATELADLLPRIIEQRREKLGPLFDRADYPTRDEVLAAYGIDWNYVSFATPERLEEVDKAAYERAVSRQDARLADAYQDVIVGLRQSAALVMRELAERLRPDADGNPRALRPTALRDLQDLLQRLPVLNSVGEDDALAALVNRVGALATGLNVDVLRQNDSIRGMLLQTAEAAAADLEKLVLTGRRAMQLGPARKAS
jgi:hypothetical protein